MAEPSSTPCEGFSFDNGTGGCWNSVGATLGKKDEIPDDVEGLATTSSILSSAVTVGCDNKDATSGGCGCVNLYSAWNSVGGILEKADRILEDGLLTICPLTCGSSLCSRVV